MQFLRDLFDPTVSANNTPISNFKMNYDTTEAQFNDMKEGKEKRSAAFYYLRSGQFYTIKPNAVAKDGNNTDDTLPITIRQPFNLTQHADIVKEHTAVFKEKFAAIFKLDLTIVGLVAAAFTVTFTPFFPFAGIIATGLWIAALGFLSQRNKLYTEYQESLTLLLTTCNWALGSTKITQHQAPELAKNAEIRGMLDCLFSVLTKKQVKHLIHDPIEHLFTAALESYDSRFRFPLVSRFFNQPNRAADAIDKELENTALKQKGADFFRSAYGPNRGTTKDLALIVFPLALDLCRAVFNAGKAYFTKPAEENTVPANGL